MPAIRSFRDLEVYRRSKREAKQIFVISKRFPRDERFSLTDQVRRSSRATGSMIAEDAASTPGNPSIRRTTWVTKLSTLAVLE